jgi:ribonuclease-3
VVGTVGPDHQPHFCIEVTVNGLQPCRAEGASKKKAEQLAAQKLLELATA